MKSVRNPRSIENKDKEGKGRVGIFLTPEVGGCVSLVAEILESVILVFVICFADSEKTLRGRSQLRIQYYLQVTSFTWQKICLASAS